VADDEDAGVALVGHQQLARVVGIEAVGEHLGHLWLDVQGAAGAGGRVTGADLRARVTGLELDPEAGEPGAGVVGLALAAGGQLAVVVWLGVVGDRLAVA
jgi:hypothetical protein